MRERLSSAVILISLLLCANSALAATEPTDLRFKVLGNPNFERFSVKYSGPSLPHQLTPGCERGLWLGTRILNFSRLEKYIPSHSSVVMTRLRFFDAPTNPIHGNRSIPTSTNKLMGRINGPSSTPYRESVDRFVSLLKESLKLLESMDSAVSCGGTTS